MTITHLATVQSGAQATTISYTLGVGESIPAGSTIHVVAAAQNTGTNTVSDSVNGAYAQDELQTSGSPFVQVALHRFSNNAALVQGDVITATFGSSSFNRRMHIGWSDDLDLSSPLDQTPTDDAGSSTTPAAGSQTLNNAAVRWIGVLGTGNGDLDVDLNEDADFTSLSTAASTNRSSHYAYRDVSSIETNDYAPTLDNATSWAAILAAYKIAAGGVTVEPTPTSAVGATVAPTVVLGALSIAPAPAAAIGGSVDPTVATGGGVTVAPAFAGASAVVAGPGVVLGGLTLAPAFAEASAGVAQPAVVLGAAGDAFVREAFRQETGEAFLVLLTIDHPDMPEPIRVTSDAVGTVSRGDTFVPFPFEIELPDQSGVAEPRARLRICNVDRQIVVTLRSLATPVTVLMEVVLASAPDIVEAVFPDFELRAAEYDSLLVEGDLTVESFIDEPYPAPAFTPANFEGLF